MSTIRMKLMPVVLVTGLLLAGRGAAGTTEAVSEVFGFDTRDSVGTTEAVSGVFSMDARVLGNAASSASGVFALGTQSGNLDALVIDAGAPGSVVAGQAVAFPALASFAGQGGAPTDVSTAATWFIVGNAPAGTRFEGNRLIAGNVSEATVIRVSAVFVFPSGAREAAPVEVTIQPATPGYRVAGIYDRELLDLGGSAIHRLTFQASSNGPHGAAAPEDVSWDLDQDGEFDDATGLEVVRDYVAGQTVRIGVRAEWPLGVGPPALAADYFYVVMNRDAVADEPQVCTVNDSLNGSFLDSQSAVFTPDPARKANGLVVLTHGMFGSGEDAWLGDMRDAILGRLSSAPPNVAIYDWERMSDPTEYRSDGQTAGEEQRVLVLDDFIDIRPYGKSQGAWIADWIDGQRQAGRVDRAAKIHLIGHSAGGFAMGEAARLLSQRLYGQIQVTMLDTPLPYHQHIKPEWRTERYISTWFGGNPTTETGIDLWNAGALLVGSKVDRFTYRRPLWSNLLAGGLNRLVAGEVVWLPKIDTGPSYYRTVIDPRTEDWFEQHAASHQYYLASISPAEQSGSAWSGEVLGDGFAQSFFVSGADFAPSGPRPAPVPRDGDGPQLGRMPPMDGFATFGQVVENGTSYRVTEEANAGIFKDGFTLPAAATSLQFELRFLAAGDGDFVSVHWDDDEVLDIIPETALAREAAMVHEVDLTGLGGRTGTLTLKLNSRGTANCEVEFSEIRILEDDDLDGDGLSNELEEIAGSDPLAIDTDGDGLTDAEEVLQHGTSPLVTDTDGDGQSDADELVAGTDPVSGQSRFAAAMDPAVAGGSATVHWQGADGRSYRIVRAQELGTMNLDFIGAGIEGSAGPMSFEDEEPPTGKAFYWIEVE